MRGTARARRAGMLVLALGAALLVGGCQYLYGYPEGNPDDFLPRPVVTYAAGSASIAIGDAPAIVLDQLTEAALYEDYGGGEATWTNGDGWYLRASGISSGGFLGSLAYVTLDRVVEGEHWTTWDSTRCILTIETVDATALRGTASCKGLRWADAIASYGMSLQPRYIPGQDAFDAEIRFEALPDGSTPA